MTRLQKKCFTFSVGLHVLLLGILLASSAFSDKPDSKDIPILNVIPANILDRAGAGGGSTEPVAPPQPVQQAQPAPAAVSAPQPQPKPQPVAPPRQPEVVERPKPREITPEPVEPRRAEGESISKPVKKHHKEPTPPHEVVPDFTPVNAADHKKKIKEDEATAEANDARAQARADARHQRQVAQALNALANSVKKSGAQGTVVDVQEGAGGGEAFAGYETVIYNVYFHAWIAPDSVANKLAAATVKIVVARDGTIISSEIIRNSGERALDKSVDRVLRAVTKLPAFPASAHDEQRSFLIRFDLEAKEGSG